MVESSRKKPQQLDLKLRFIESNCFFLSFPLYCPPSLFFPSHGFPLLLLLLMLHFDPLWIILLKVSLPSVVAAGFYSPFEKTHFACSGNGCCLIYWTFLKKKNKLKDFNDFRYKFLQLPVICCGLISFLLIALSFSSITLQNYTWWIMKIAPLMKGTMNNPCGSLIFDVPVVTASSALSSLSAGKWMLSCEMALNASPVLMIIIIIS